MTDTDTFWEASPILVNNMPCWLLRKHHTDGGKKFRDAHGTFAFLEDLRAAITHLESEPVRIPAKGAE